MQRYKNCLFQVDLFENLKNNPLLQIAKNFNIDKPIKGIRIHNNETFIVYTDDSSFQEKKEQKIDLKFEDLVKYFKNIKVFIG